MDLRLLLTEVLAPGDLFLLSWRPYVPPHPSQLPGLQFGLLRASCLCWGREILLCRADKIENLIKAGLKPLLAPSGNILEMWLHGAGAEGGGWVWEPRLRCSHRGKLRLGFVSHMSVCQWKRV